MVAGGIDTIQTGADYRHARRRATQAAAVGRCVDAGGHAAGDAKAAVAEAAGECLGIRKSLGRSVAAADDGEKVCAEKFAAPL